ncbi:MAG: integrase core domain-containing protein [Corynebacterium sp.]|nr:integrase core domain-containing protein [Corynebacterium sp.]
MPTAIRIDNGPELRSRIIKEWAAERGVEILYCPPGKPWHNGFIESFHNRARFECLNTHAFDNLEECIYALENWQHQYNNQHPHSALNRMTPTSSTQPAANKEYTS